MGEKFYSKDIEEMIRDFIRKDGLKYNYDEHKGIFTFRMETKGKTGKKDFLDYLITVGKGEYIIYAVLPLLADVCNERMMSALAEFICRINYGLEKGSFEIHMADGMIQFKYYINCINITHPKEIVENSIMWPLTVYGRYSAGFICIAEGNYNAGNVAKMCEEIFLGKILSDYRAEMYGIAGEEDVNGEDYFYDNEEDINLDIELDIDDDNVYYDADHLDRFLGWCVSQQENERMDFEVNMNLFEMEGDEDE